MKIRIRGNSVRYRLTRSEIEILCSDGVFKECTHFNNNMLSYIIKAKKGISNLNAEFIDNTITLYMPSEFTENWLNSDLVGYENNLQLQDGTSLYLLVEKDFVCMDETVEDQSDNFPNPSALKLGK